MTLVQVEREGAVASCWLSRPESGNPLSAEMMGELAGAVESCDGDPGIGCILITGGDQAFACGGEVEAVRAGAPLEDLASASGTFWERMGACRTPLLAAVSGFAVGAGFELALLCDLVIASESAEFGLPEIGLGLLPGGGATQRLTHLIGRQRAMETVLAGRRIDADEAYALGIANQVHKAKAHLDRSLAVAALVASRPPLSAQLAKQAIRAAETTALEEGLAIERDLHLQALATEDRIEGTDAFLEQRQPEFRGR